MEGSQDLLTIIISIGAGTFALLGAIFNWDFFYKNNSSRLFMSLLGRGGSRIFYALLGAFLLYCGINMILSSPS